MQEWTVANPHKDFTPIDFLYEVDKDFLCYPGQCSAYTSVGYMLLGLALSEHTAPGTATQFSFDQMSVVPQGVKELVNFSFANTGFPLKGPCTSAKNIVPKQYKTVYPPKGAEFILRSIDISKTSCLNGWTCGNLAASAEDIAQFFYLLLGPRLAEIALTENAALLRSPTNRIVTPWVSTFMADFDMLTTGWAAGQIEYGYGTMMNVPGAPMLPNMSTFVPWIGHGGMDYGSMGQGYYNPSLQFGFSLAMNSDIGMNYTWNNIPVGNNMTDAYINLYAYGSATCNTADAVLDEVSHGAVRLNCNAQMEAWKAEYLKSVL